jgi:predicted choloylglycine hydrolase
MHCLAKVRRGGEACRTILIKRLMLECDDVDEIVQLYKRIPVAMNTN